MPTCELDERDIIKMLNYITNNGYNINHIVSITVIDNNKLKIFWRP